jgi:integrase
VAIEERVRKRDGIRTYYIDFRDQQGRRVRELAGTTAKQARDLLTVRLGEVRAGTYVNPRDLEDDRGPTFEEFTKRFLREHPGERRSDHYPKVVKRILPYFEDVPIREISRSDLDRFRVRLLTEPVPKLGRPLSTTSVLKILRTLHRVLKVAVRWGVIETNPAVEMQKPPARKHKTRFLTPEEFQKVEAAALDWLRPMLRMAVTTGMRLKEVVGLRWEDVDRNAGVIHVNEDSKTGTRVVPMSVTVRQILASQVRHVVSPMVFVKSDGTDYTSGAARTWISQATKRAMRKAGIEDASFHTLRHTAAAWMVQEGATLFEVQNVLGHSTPVMTQRYAHLQPDHLRRAVSGLDRKINSPKTRSTSPKASE